MDWDKLRVFYAVADAGSLTHAGESLHLSQSAVSRQIRGLEESLGATLFHRHARGLILTEQGELLYSASRDIAARLHLATAQIADAKLGDAGDLKVEATHGLGSLWLAPRLSRFFESHPNISIHLILTERALDLPMREADVAIRLREPEQADLIRRPLADTSIRYFASTAYIERHGAPAGPEDLRHHRLVTYQADDRAALPPAVTDWLDEVSRLEHHTDLTVNNYFAVMQAAEAGLGIAPLPDYLSRHNTDLVQVMPEVVSPTFSLFLSYAEELKRSQRVLAFRDFILEEARDL